MLPPFRPNYRSHNKLDLSSGPPLLPVLNKRNPFSCSQLTDKSPVQWHLLLELMGVKTRLGVTAQFCPSQPFIYPLILHLSLYRAYNVLGGK